MMTGDMGDPSLDELPTPSDGVEAAPPGPAAPIIAYESIGATRPTGATGPTGLSDCSSTPSASNQVSISGDEQAEEVGKLTFKIYYAGAVRTTPMTVNWRIREGTAKAGADFTSAMQGSTTLVAPPVPAGCVSQAFYHEVVVNVVDDNVVELDEQFQIELTSTSDSWVGISSTGRRAAGIVRNVADFAEVRFFPTRVADTFVEGTAGTATNLPYAIYLTNPVDVPVRVGHTATDGTASASKRDYRGTNGYTDLAANSQAQILLGTRLAPATSTPISILGDAVVEADEHFDVTLASIAAAGRDVRWSSAPNDQSRRVTIQDDDVATVRFVPNTPVTVVEGRPITLKVELLGAVDTSVDVTVQAFLRPGDTATIGDDLGSATQSLTFSGRNGEGRSFQVATYEDQTVELNETFSVQILNVAANGRNVVISPTSNLIAGTIRNDDIAYLNVSDAVEEENQQDPVNPSQILPLVPFEFTVSISKPLDVDLPFQYATRITGTTRTSATPGEDFLPVVATGVIRAGTTSAVITIQVVNDDRIEPTQYFGVFVTILNALSRNVFPRDPFGQGTILDTLDNAAR